MTLSNASALARNIRNNFYDKLRNSTMLYLTADMGAKLPNHNINHYIMKNYFDKLETDMLRFGFVHLQP